MSNTNETTYEGWTNRATWLVNLHLNNDQSVYNEVNELVLKEQRLIDAEDDVRDYVKEFFEDVPTDTFQGMLSLDIVGTFLGQVNWREIVEGWVSGSDEYEVGKTGDDFWQIVLTADVDA